MHYELALQQVNVSSEGQLRKVGNVLGAHREALSVIPNQSVEFLYFLLNKVLIDKISTLSFDDLVSDSLPDAGDEPGVLLSLFPDLVSEVVERDAGA